MEADRFWSRPHVLVQVLLLVVVGGLACAFGLFVLGGALGLAFAVVLPAWVAYGVYRAARVSVSTRPDGVRVVNAKTSYDVPWADVERFAFVQDTPRGPPGAYLVRTDGQQMPVDVLRGPDVTTGRHRRWAAEAMEELNRRAERRRLSAR